ncbi:hypothetical protein D8Y22_04270 [Salinadaptatus halalkaliphilus]|uniref:Uncharacterized protein n=1 Tax=Salinadaptatus halalkaliphilus TaxID=2419781 RepID=A0A4S3TPC2_9EURY|nr:hypothetical protein [Salinadaptatus halalkaliphilus]THE66141.1 hypothetical protein D8Y22_04270 [Salinadaptatus halalkaliphilus]
MGIDDGSDLFTRKTLVICVVAFLFGNAITIAAGGWQWELVFVLGAACLLLETIRRSALG